MTSKERFAELVSMRVSESIGERRKKEGFFGKIMEMKYASIRNGEIFEDFIPKSGFLRALLGGKYGKK